MLLSHETSVKLNADHANILGHMCYAAYKLWNVLNYERQNYKELGLSEYPDWYYQKKHHKDDLWYKQLPSQTAQETCKILDGAWKSLYAPVKSHGVVNPKPPRYKHGPISITYMQNGMRHERGADTIRLSIPKKLKEYMSEAYDIHENYLFLKNRLFEDMDIVKQVKIYPPKKGTCTVIVIYEVPDVPMLPDNGRYLSIDLELHNLMTCLDSGTNETFIVGRKYLSLCHYFSKEIARVQSQWARAQTKRGIKHPKPSRHAQKLYFKKNNAIKDYLHKITRYVVDYCERNDIHTVIIGDITGIRENRDFGHVTNQKFHALPYKKIYLMLEYKLALCGISFIRQNEAYSSQTSPLQPAVSKANAKNSNRIKRGLYKDGDAYWNADCVGAYNILRLYLAKTGSPVPLNPYEIKSPYVAKVAV